jgi:LPS-assembly protein
MSFIKKDWFLLTTASLVLNLNVAFAQEDLGEPIDIKADKFTYSKNGEELIAEGQVKVVAKEGTLYADKLVFNQTADKIYAIGNVKFIDYKNNTTLSDKLELTGDFKKGLADHIMMMFSDSTGILTSKKAVKINETRLNLYDAEYTACEVDEDSILPWELTADKVAYDSEEESITYTNAVLDIFNIPVLYTPIFHHSTNSKKPVTGFLNLGLASSNSDGFGLKSGYFWSIDEQNDATLRFKYLGKRGILLGAEHRYVGENFDSDIRLEGIEDSSEENKLKGFLSAEGEYVFEAGQRAGFNLKLPSDEDYLETFRDDSDAYTKSTIYAEKATQDSYLGLSSRYFVDMRDDVDDETLAQPVARVQAEKVIKTDETNGQLKLNLDVLSLQRQSGKDTNRIISKAEYIKPFYTPDGSLFEFAGNVRADYYQFNEDVDGGDDKTESRFLPELSVSWEKPFISPSFKHIVSPKLMFITSPDKNFAEIPNEDSTSFELDATNLFDTNRFSGWDKVETGNRLVYGFDTKYGKASNLKFHGFLGQSYNFSDKEENISDDTSANNKNSDWVGFARFEPNDYLAFGTNFRLDSSSFASQRVDSYAIISKKSEHEQNYDLEKDYIKFAHSFLKEDSEEANIYGYYNLDENVALRARIQRNMFENMTLKQELETIYHSGCYNLSFKVRKTQSTSDPASLDFIFNFAILPTGRK